MRRAYATLGDPINTKELTKTSEGLTSGSRKRLPIEEAPCPEPVLARPVAVLHTLFHSVLHAACVDRSAATVLGAAHAIR
jgi:hypothetical protein